MGCHEVARRVVEMMMMGVLPRVMMKMNNG